MADDSTSRLPRFPFSRGNVPSDRAPMPRGSDNDPLAELARLIGHTDPFGTNARNRAPMPAPAPQSYESDYDRSQNYQSQDYQSQDYQSDYQEDDRYPADHRDANGHNDGWPGSPASGERY